MDLQKKNRFLVFSVYRAVMFTGLCGVLIFLNIFGPTLWRFYFGSGQAFHYDTGSLAVHYVDVGQGDCAVVQFPDGRVAVIDSGTGYYYSRVKNYLLTRILKHTRKIDFVIATHPHDDHVGGFNQLLYDFDVNVVYRPHNVSSSEYDTGPLEGEAKGPLENTAVYAGFITAAYTYAAEVRFIVAGEEITDGVSFFMYFHTPSLEFVGNLNESFEDYNNISPIITLRHERRVFIFTGDAGVQTETAFRADAIAQSIENDYGFGNLHVYLKVGHHGSRSSSSVDFLDFIKPNKAVISLGARNVYNFPHIELLARLYGAGLKDDDIWQTSEFGNIAVVCNNNMAHVYFAFDNEADLAMFYILAFIVIWVVCFVDFRKDV